MTDVTSKFELGRCANCGEHIEVFEDTEKPAEFIFRFDVICKGPNPSKGKTGICCGSMGTDDPVASWKAIEASVADLDPSVNGFDEADPNAFSF